MKKFNFISMLLVALFCSANMWGAAVEITPENPYTNSFDTETLYGIPSGWTKVVGTAYYPSVDSKSNIPTYGGSARGLVFQGYSSDGQMVLALPEFSDDIKYLTLDFYFKSKGSSYPATMSVGYTTSLTDKSQYHSVQSISYYTDGFTKETVDFSTVTPAIPDGAYIAISFEGTGTYSKKGALYIDDVTVTTSYVAPAGSCAKPKNLTKSDDTPEGATFTWEQNTDETTYQWACVVSGSEVTEWNTLDENIRTKTVTGLTAGTAYDFHVRSYCGAGEGEQSASAKSTFTPTCPAPTAPVVSGISATGATLSWTAAAGISNYQYIVVASEAAQDWTSPTLVEGATNATLTGLNPSTNYDVYVRSYYSATTQSTALKTSFQTACGAVTIPFTWDFPSIGCWTKDENCHSSTGVSNGAFMFYYKVTPPYQTLISPEFVALSSTVDVKFDYKAHQSTYPETFALGYSTTTSDLASFTWLSDETVTNTTYTQYEKTLPAGVKYIAIQCKSNDKYYLYIDNFSIEETPACPAPTITASNVIYNAATINCAGGSTENKWRLQYKAAGDADWTDANGGNLIAAASFDLTGLTPGTAYQAQAQAACAGAWSTAVAFTPTYIAPTDLTVTATTTTTATFSWTANSGETAWTVQYKKSGDADWTTVEDVTVNPYTLTGLTSGSSYQVKVAAGTLYTAAVDFNTECEAKAIPFSADFNDAEANKLPSCWSAAGNTTAVYVAASSSYLTLSSKALYFTGGSGTQAIAILPEIDADLNTLQIAFSHVEESTTKSGQIKFGYYKDATFTELKTCEYSSSSSVWKDEAAFPITGVPAEAKLAFSYTPIQSAYTAALDNISITEYVAPSCATPTALTVNDVTTNSASVSWTSEAANFALEYKKTSEADWTAATAPIASPFVLANLMPNETEYTVRVKAICGENNESEWTELIAPFKTQCAVKTVTEETAWTEDFEAQTVDQAPACWYLPTPNDSYYYAKVITSDAKESTRCLDIKTYGTSSEIIVLPEFNEPVEHLNISFDYKNVNTGSKYGYLEVGYYSGSTFTLVGEALSKVENYTASGVIEMPKTGVPSGARIAFRLVGVYSGYTSHAYIDNLSVTRKPACAIPTNLQAVATSTGATLTWTAGDEETQWNVRYSVKDAESWTVLENKTSGFAITGLEVGTTYEAQVQAYCDEDHQSAWTTSAIFTPVCGAAPTALTVSARSTNAATLTWEGSESAFKLQTSLDGENWEDAVDVNAKTYDLISLTAGTMYYVRVQNACGGEYATTSFTTWCGAKDAAELPLNITAFTAVPDCWEINFVGENSGIANNKIFFYGDAEQMAVLPAYDIELNKLSVTFGFSTTASLEFGYLDEPNGTFHAFASQPSTGVELNLENEPAEAKYIAIRYTATSAYASGSISSVLLRKTPTCAKPTDLTATPAVGAASIDWTSEATSWNLQYKLASAAEWTDAAVTEKPYEITGLAQGASYKVRVQVICGEEMSDWSDEIIFTTNCSSIDALPYYADFTQALSSCWVVFAQNESYYKPTVNTAMQQLTMNGGKEGYSNNVVVMPPFSADLTNAVISLEYSCSTGANYAQLEVGYLTDKADAATFVALQTLDRSGSWTEARVAAATVPANAYIAFRYAGASSIGDAAIRNLRVIEALTLSDNTDNTALLAANIGKTLDVQIGRTFVCADYYNTLCLPFDLATLGGKPLAGGELWAFKYAKVENNELLIRIIEAESIEAGVPYLIAFPAGENIVNPTFKNVTISATTGQNIGDASVAQLCGIIEKPVVFAPHDQTKLFLAENNTLYWWDGDDASQLNNFRAYFLVNTNSGANNAPRHGMRARIIKEEQVITGVEEITNGELRMTNKILRNGQLLIIYNGTLYNAQGQIIK